MKPAPRKKRLPRTFYDRSTLQVARDLLGKLLMRRSDGRWIGGMIIETEAYLASDDLASHSARGQTPSNASMFGKPGTLYVYPIHAKYCLNAVTERQGDGCAVLIRAIEPIWGIEQMQQSRGLDEHRRLTSGPAMLCQALGVDRDDDGVDLVRGSDIDIRDAQVDFEDEQVVTTTRIGLSKAADLPYRFYIRDNVYVSRRG